MTTISHAELKQFLHYDGATGIFTWIKKPSRRVCVGDIAGGDHGDGYMSLRIRGQQYFLHRLAFYYMNGCWPSQDVDHENGNRSDNRWSNLRSAGKSINQQNMRKPMRHNKSGFLGVSPVPNGRFKAQIHVNGRRLFLGHFDQAEAAYQVYVEAKRVHHPGCTI